MNNKLQGTLLRKKRKSQADITNKTISKKTKEDQEHTNSMVVDIPITQRKLMLVSSNKTLMLFYKKS